MRLKEYEVLYAERAENTAYVCRGPSGSGLYRVIETADRARISKYIKFFVTFRPREFYEDFCLNDKYYAVFYAPDGIPLKNSEEPVTARKIVKALAMQNPPLEIAVKILSREHIFVCGDGIEFAYDLPETDAEITYGYFFKKLADFVNSLCGTRADRNTEKWLAELRNGKFENLLDAYRGMPETSEEDYPPNKEHSEKIKAVLLKAAAAAAAIAAIITAVSLALERGGEDCGYSQIESLGTIDLTKK